jgi:cAMP phosphodiesterase
MNINFCKSKTLLIVSFLLLAVTAQTKAQSPMFKVVPLGVKGGSDESNLSSYMLAPINSDKYVCLDAGTLYSGIRKAISNGLFHQSINQVLKYNIKGYLISHAHLDHIAGMIINSPDDTSKNIYALPSVIKILTDKYFTWESWANFADAGEKPSLNKYHYVTLDTAKEIEIANTEMQVTPFSLSHVNPYESTAFLVRYNDSYILYLGDTGPDEIEKSDKLQLLWQYIASLIQSKRLKGIFIEVSFPNEQPDKQLFGHLTPKWLMTEMDALSILTGTKALKNLPVVITHTKPSGNNENIIKRQLLLSNKLHLKILYPQQGTMMKF